MTPWPRFEFHRLVEIPRLEQRDGEAQPSEQRRRDAVRPLLASLLGAHVGLLGADEPAPALLSAWVRPRGEKRLHLLVGGRPSFPPAARERIDKRMRQVSFPPGAIAEDVSLDEAGAMLERFGSWVPCAGRPDALWAPKDGQSGRSIGRRGSFAQHVAHLGGAFTWLVLAEPLRPQVLKPELDLLMNQILPLSRAQVGEEHRIAHERKQARYRELSRAQAGGAWRIRVLVGSEQPELAATAAGILCSSADLDELPYVLSPAGPPVSLERALGAHVTDDYGGSTAFTASSELLEALIRPPDRELPGMRLVEPHTFDVSPEMSDDESGVPLPLGSVLDVAHTEVGQLLLHPDSLNRHTFVCGATGSGKSQTIRHLLTEATMAGLPWLAVEPAKAEYRLMAARLAGTGHDVIVIRPGDPDAPPAGFNPLKPAPGFALQTHADLLRALFLAAFEAQEPFPQVLAAALTRCYQELGWDLTLGKPVPGRQPRWPTLADLQRVAALVVNEIGYGKEIADNVQGFIRVRLGSLRMGTTGRFFEGGHPLDFEKLRRRNVVLQIQDIGDDQDKAFFMGAILIQLTEHLRARADRDGEDTASRPLEHLTVIEEAHRLLRRAEPGTAGPAAHAVEMFASLLAEVRAYGEGLIIAEQIPSKLTEDVIKNTAVKIVHRLPAADDREAVGATMNVDKPQSRFLVTLVRGEAAVFTDGMDRPLLVRVANGTEAERTAARAFAPVTELIGSRSPTCDAACLAQPCTLTQMRGAQLLLDQRRWLSVWAELTVLAHLAGCPTPMIDQAQLATLDATVTGRLLHCACSHAVDSAVAVRSAMLQADVAPADLQAHCIDVLTRQLARASVADGCGYGEPQYLSRPHRWLQVLDALEEDLDADGTHPDTALWEQRFLCRIPGATRREQYDAVSQWKKLTLDDEPASRDTITFGTSRPSALEAAIGGTVGDSGWRQRVHHALEPFSHVGWALDYLMPEA